MPFTHNTILKPEQIFLSSSENTLSNGTAKSNLSFELKNQIHIPPNVECFIHLNSFKFVNSFYNIHSTNNKLYYSIDPYINDILEIEIPIGNYSITTLITYINSQISPITATYSTSTFKITFTAANNFKFWNGNNNCLKVLGFNEEDTTETTSKTSPNLINLGGSQILYIVVNNLNLYSNGYKNSILNNVLESIPISVLAGVSQTYVNQNTTRYKINVDTINRLEILIYDENNNLVDFNNNNWYINLSFIFSYKNQYIPPSYLIDGQITYEKPSNRNNDKVLEENTKREELNEEK